MRVALRIVATTVAALAAAPALQAHDFWIAPSRFHPDPGTTVAIGLRTGQNFVGDAVRRSDAGIERFFVRQAGRDEPVTGIDGADPAGWLRVDGEATAIVAYRSRPAFIEMPPDKFEAYLRMEGLERIVEIRRQRGTSATPGREYFSRYAKALLAGRRESDAVTRPVGLEFEIVPEADPTARLGPFRGRVLYEGEPLAGALVVAMLDGEPSAKLATRSDSRGSFTFSLPRPGVWLIKSVHMIRVWWWFSRADWESFWASLTFETR